MTISTCPFCQIPPERIVLENDLALVIRDGFPITEGHTLVIPRRQVGSFFAITKAERAAMLVLLEQSKAGLDAEHQPDGYNIGINDGPAGGGADRVIPPEIHRRQK